MKTSTAVLLILLFVACRGAAPPGIVTFGDVQLTGEVETNELLAQMRPLDPRMEACYARAKRDDHSVQGDIQLHIQGGDGRLVPEVRSNTTGSDSLAACVTSAIAGLTIVEPETGPRWDFEVDWTLTFTLVTRDRSS